MPLSLYGSLYSFDFQFLLRNFEETLYENALFLFIKLPLYNLNRLLKFVKQVTWRYVVFLINH